MKNRRLAIVAILLVAVLCLGIGFAALTDDLSIGGSVSINKDLSNQDFNVDVHFDPAQVPTIDTPPGANPTATVTAVLQADANGGENDHLVITVPAGVLNFTGEEVVVTAYIINDSDEFDAEVKINNTVTVDDGGLCDVTCLFENDTNTVTIEKGESDKVIITIKLKETVTGDETFKLGDFTFALGATAVKP